MRKVLYLGLNPKNYCSQHTVVHYPLIQIQPIERESIEKAIEESQNCTHWIFTSQIAVQIVSPYLKNLDHISAVAVGRATAHALQQIGKEPELVAERECQEGIIDMLEGAALIDPYFFWPRSAKARALLSSWIRSQGWRLLEKALYQPVVYCKPPLPDLKEFDEIIFTSPSTVDAFLHVFHTFPEELVLHAIGPVTQARLDFLSSQTHNRRET